MQKGRITSIRSGMIAVDPQQNAFPSGSFDFILIFKREAFVTVITAFLGTVGAGGEKNGGLVARIMWNSATSKKKPEPNAD